MILRVRIHACCELRVAVAAHSTTIVSFEVACAVKSLFEIVSPQCTPCVWWSQSDGLCAAGATPAALVDGDGVHASIPRGSSILQTAAQVSVKRVLSSRAF